MPTRLLAARIAWHEGRAGDAAAEARKAARAADADTDVLDLAETLLLVGETALAHELLERMAWPPAGPADRLLRHADLQHRLGRHDRALAVLDRLLDGQPGQGKWHYFRARQLEFLGRTGEAEAAYLACLAQTPDYGHAAYGLVRLRRQTRDDHHLDRIETGLRCTQPGTGARADFEFARYHVCEDLGRDEEAWQALATANATMHGLMAAEAAQQQAGLQRLCEALMAQPVPPPAAAAADGPCPIFIIGLPRSGTTVLERMLANHSRVAGAGELTDLARQLLRVANARDIYDASFLAGLPALDLAEVGRGYREQTAWRAGDKAYFVDKQPFHWALAGWIHAALPEAKILHLVRDPMDTCFSIWRARFASTHAWSYDFATLAERFHRYRRMMRHWYEACPGVILDVAYADLVTEPAAALRKVLDFCGLAWETGCEDLSRNATAVSTLSAVQVREPVHTRGIGHWRRHAEPLEPLRQRLSTAP